MDARMPVRLIVSAFIVVGSSVPVLSLAQSATCAHLDYAEMKGMARNDLEMAYCDATFNIKRARIHSNLASKLQGINRQRGDSPDRSAQTVNNDRMGAEAENDEQACLNERDRIGRVLIGRKANMSKIDKECPLDDK